MTRDKQLSRISIRAVRLKRDFDQALNMKEFAVLAGVSYSVAREWFQLPGFPSLLGKVFWGDFVVWRRKQNAWETLNKSVSRGSRTPDPMEQKPSNAAAQKWPAR